MALQRLRFWPSPFYEPLEYVSSIVQVPDAPPPGGRRSVHLAFSLTQQQKEMVKDTQYVIGEFRTQKADSSAHTSCVSFPPRSSTIWRQCPLDLSLIHI